MTIGAAVDEMRARTRWRQTAMVPAIVTAVRVIALPGVIVLWLHGLRAETLTLYGVILLSDAADGRIARKLGTATRFGAYLDVIADMVVILVLLSVLCVCGAIPIWVPVAPGAVAAAFLASSGRSAPRYDPIGKHYGTALYLSIAVLLGSADERLCSAICFAISVLSVVVLAGRAARMRRGARIEA